MRAAAASPRGAAARRNPVTGKPMWSKRARTAARCSSGSPPMRKGATHLAELPTRGPTFEELGDQWLDGVERGRIGRRRGRGKPYSETTIASDAPLAGSTTCCPEFGDRVRRRDHRDRLAAVDRPARPQGPVPLDDRQAHLASRRASTRGRRRRARRLVPRNPLRLVELPPNDEKPRLRVALAPEAAALLAALEPEDRLPYAIAFYAGLRRSEIYRLEWPDVLDGDRIATRLLVRRSKSEAGTQRRPPIADNLRTVLADAWERQGRPRDGKVVDRSVMSGKIAAPRRSGLGRPPA